IVIGLLACPLVGLVPGASPSSIDWRRVESCCAPAPVREVAAESVDAWLDSIRLHHKIPAIGAIVFRADTILARGIAGVRRSNARVPVEWRDRFHLGSNS